MALNTLSYQCSVKNIMPLKITVGSRWEFGWVSATTKEFIIGRKANAIYMTPSNNVCSSSEAPIELTPPSVVFPKTCAAPPDCMLWVHKGELCTCSFVDFPSHTIGSKRYCTGYQCYLTDPSLLNHGSHIYISITEPHIPIFVICEATQQCQHNTWYCLVGSSGWPMPNQ